MLKDSNLTNKELPVKSQATYIYSDNSKKAAKTNTNLKFWIKNLENITPIAMMSKKDSIKIDVLLPTPRT